MPRLQGYMAPGDSVGIAGLLGMGPHCPGAGGSGWHWEFGDIEGAGELQGELMVPGYGGVGGLEG